MGANRFRIYDEKDHVMRCFELNQMLERHFFYYGSFDTKILVYEKMKSTCMTDKNGKEIYENDIVSAWSDGCHANGIVKQRVDGLWIMFPAWKGGKAWGLCPNEDGCTTVEIIGNTYESPELAKEVICEKTGS